MKQKDLYQVNIFRIVQAAWVILAVLSLIRIAAIFIPPRRRNQDVIDRCFMALAQFAAAVCQEVGIGSLITFLLAIVAETIQPANPSLWLRPLKI